MASKKDEAEGVVPKPRRARNKVAAPRARRGGSKYTRKEVDGRHEPQKRILSPIQIRVLNTFLDPECATRADVAAKTGVGEKTISSWLTNHDLFREEYWRRVHTVADQIAHLGVAGFESALVFLIKVVRDESGKYDFDQRMEAAKQLIASQKIKVELSAVLSNVTNNHLHVGQPAPAPTSVESPEAIPSVRRLMATMPSEDALREDAKEMRLIAEQILAYDRTASDEPGVLDGEYSSVAADT